MSPFSVPLAQAAAMFPAYTFIRALTPSAQKAAFHVRDAQGNDFCLKIISPDYERDRLDREIQALQIINHPNVVKLIEYTFSSKSGQRLHYLIEEFIDGKDLKDILLPGQAWARKDVSAFFAAVCDGLSALKDRE